MTDTELKFEHGFEILHPHINLSPNEQKELDSFLHWYNSLETALAQPIEEPAGLKQTDSMVRWFIEDEGLRACLENNPEFLANRLKEMPTFPYTWPSDVSPVHVCPFAVSLRLTELNQMIPPRRFEPAKLAEIAKSMRKQAASILAAAEKVEQGTF
ncbi:hypothetical protein [Methylobacterium soli]|uniref:Uncharacterized protein n=1 Tax=Methylobacterium soli TaxID=553447 RepID=A0A6L3SN78_9HYPH|nr:hypothetical protein [Methylobacterium soli]KAB1067999.1 hypothetical protein F6X53_31880 [Methylobacterium soli]GJE46589.1 hypothetical protein AEGHOMDF_5795 [Methylobacterium soli]